MRIAPDGKGEDGEWFGLWVQDMSSPAETWIGSLKFPYVDDKALIYPFTYANIEVYGRDPVRPIDIPLMSISVKPPRGDGTPADSASIGYTPFNGQILNSEVRCDPDKGAIFLEAGGPTLRETEGDRWVYFSASGTCRY